MLVHGADSHPLQRLSIDGAHIARDQRLWRQLDDQCLAANHPSRRLAVSITFLFVVVEKSWFARRKLDITSGIHFELEAAFSIGENGLILRLYQRSPNRLAGDGVNHPAANFHGRMMRQRRRQLGRNSDAANTA